MGLKKIVLAFFTVVGWSEWRIATRVDCWIGHYKLALFENPLEIAYQLVMLCVLVRPMGKSLGDIVIDDFLLDRWVHLLYVFLCALIG